MKRSICFLILLILCMPLMAENTNALNLSINGVTGTVLANVEKRLNELQHTGALEGLDQDELRHQISQALQPYGYFKAKIRINVTNTQSITINIIPGPQIYCSSVEVIIEGEGQNNPAILKVVNELTLKPGTPLFTEVYNQAKQNIINSAENAGFLHGAFSKAEILINEQDNTAQITLIFNTGSLYYFGQVQFDPTNINPELLHRFVPFHQGQPYSTEQVLKLNDHLSNSGYFNSVLVKPEITDEKMIPIKVHLQPVPKYSYSLGAGYGTDTGVRGRAGLYVVPVNRRGHKFNALAQGSFTQNSLQAQYLIPGANPVIDQYSITGNFSSLNYNTGYSNAFLLSLAQQHNLEHLKRSLSLNGLYESFHYSLQSNENQVLLYPKASVTLSQTSNILFSPSGYNITFNGLGANKFTCSNLDFGQLSVDAKAAIRIDSLRLRLYGHTIQGITATSNINKLPLSLALLLGGTDNLKGYSFNSIGPGRIISYGGFEVQKEMKKNWYLIGFYDAGDVYNPTPKEFQYDVGAGLMWVSPIGPIKAGLAQPVNSKLQRTSSGPRLVISLGPDL